MYMSRLSHLKCQQVKFDTNLNLSKIMNKLELEAELEFQKKKALRNREGLERLRKLRASMQKTCKK